MGEWRIGRGGRRERIEYGNEEGRWEKEVWDLTKAEGDEV